LGIVRVIQELFRAILKHGIGSTERRLAHLEHGSNATYMGDGLVLVRAQVHGLTIAYLVEARDRLISPWFIVSGRYETELTDFFVRILRPDDHCLDLGANFGYYTCLFARFCPKGKVIGVEPDPSIHTLVRDNIHINGFGSIASARLAAMSANSEPVTLYRRVGRSGNTSIFRAPDHFTELLGEKPAETFTAAGLTVDALAQELGRVDIMKVDVEGAEPLVLEGATGMLAANPAVQIVMEWSPGQMRAAGADIGAVLDRFAELGLNIYTLGGRPEPLSRDTLLACTYAAGVLLTRSPRAT
jgi:FkbM family methyltransferase